MPSWCDNRVHVSTNRGNRKDLERFKDYVSGIDENGISGVFCFNEILPVPKELEDTDGAFRNKDEESDLVKKYGADNWYLWRYQNWSTKWDAADPTLDENLSYFDEELTYKFRSAWGPPYGILLALFEEFPDLDIKCVYWSESNQFMYPGLIAHGPSFEDGGVYISDDDKSNPYVMAGDSSHVEIATNQESTFKLISAGDPYEINQKQEDLNV